MKRILFFNLSECANYKVHSEAPEKGLGTACCRSMMFCSG